MPIIIVAISQIILTMLNILEREIIVYKNILCVVVNELSGARVGRVLHCYRVIIILRDSCEIVLYLHQCVC